MKIPLGKIDENIVDRFDVLLVSASYEDRCLSVVEKLNLDNFAFKFVSVSSPHKDQFIEKLETFEHLGFTFIFVDNTKQIETINNLALEISKILTDIPSASFLVDISTFTKQTLLILFRFLRNTLSKQNKIKFVYTPAEEYSIGLPNKEKWLSRGILDVNSVFGYSGIIRPSRPFHLLILMGYEVERASSLITAYEPSKISIGYASKDCSISDELYQLNKDKFNELLSEFPNAESFEFSCIDIDECKINILNQASKYTDCNVIISPMNNKLSAIACALAAFENDEIQLAIAIPALYNNEKYSTPSSYCYFFEITDFLKK